MPMDLLTMLSKIESEDGQLKQAASKLGHEPEQGHMDNAGLESPVGQALGRGPMDAKAILEEKGLRDAGKDLEGRTFQDPREAFGARNIGNTAGQAARMPTAQGRHLTRPTNIHLPAAPATHRVDTLAGGKTAQSKISWLKRADESSLGAEEVAERGKGVSFKQKVKEAPRAAWNWARANKGKAALVAGGALAAGAGAIAMKKREKEASESGQKTVSKRASAGPVGGQKKKASLSEYMQAYYAGETGVKLASEAYDETSVAMRELQRREAVAVGCGLAEGMIVSKLAQLAK